MTEATPVAMEVWRKAKDACITGWAATDDQAAAAVIATALADMQRRVEALEAENERLENALMDIASRAHAHLAKALSDKTQEKNGDSHPTPDAV